MTVACFPQFLALDITGQPHRWISYQQAAKYYAEDLIAWSIGGNDHRIHGGTQRVSGIRSILDLNTILAIKGLAKALRHTPNLTNKVLFRRDQNICAYCGTRLTKDRLTRDHVTPKCKGGKDGWNNVVTACKPCNAYKGDRGAAAASMDLLYVPYTPERAEYLILRNRKILADQMDFLVKQVRNKKSRLFN